MTTSSGGSEQADDFEQRREYEFAAVRTALERAGVPSEDFGRFVNDTRVLPVSRFDSARAVPILLEWLPRVRHPDGLETIVDHLAVKAAKPVAARPLLEAFTRIPASAESLKWAIGSALDVVSDESVVDDLIRLASESSHGRGRQMIVLRLGRARRSERVVECLLPLLYDEDVTLHAMAALRQQIGPQAAAAHIAPLADSPSPRIQRAAQQELRKIASHVARTAR